MPVQIVVDYVNVELVLVLGVATVSEATEFAPDAVPVLLEQAAGSAASGQVATAHVNGEWPAET